MIFKLSNNIRLRETEANQFYNNGSLPAAFATIQELLAPAEVLESQRSRFLDEKTLSNLGDGKAAVGGAYA